MAKESRPSDFISIDFREGDKIHLLDSLRDAFDQQISTDFSLISLVDHSEIRCHKLVLIMCSKLFEHLFVVQRYDKSHLSIPYVSGHMLRSMVMFMYHQQMKIPAKQLHTAMDLAGVFWIKGLKSDSIKESPKDHADREFFLDALYAHLNVDRIPFNPQIQAPPGFVLSREDLTPPESPPDGNPPVDQPPKKKRNRGKGYKKYTEEARTCALGSVINSGMDPLDAAKKFKIPIRTLYHYLNQYGYSGSMPQDKSRPRAKRRSHPVSCTITAPVEPLRFTMPARVTEEEVLQPSEAVVEVPLNDIVIKQEIKEEPEDREEQDEF